MEAHPEKITSSRLSIPQWVQELRPSFDRSFKEDVHARLLWSLLTGDKRLISPAFSRAMNSLQLAFLLSFSSYQLYFFWWIAEKAFKKIQPKKTKIVLRALLITVTFFMPFLSIKRLAIMRALKFFNREFRFHLSLEFIFVFTFVLSFLLGHFSQSPISFIFSFLFIGGFIACDSYSRKELTLCLLSNQIIISLYFHKSYFLLSILTVMALVPLTLFLIVIGYFYLLSFRWIELNWIESGVQIYMSLIKWMSKLIAFSEITPSFAWLFLVWMMLLKIRARYFLPLSIVSIATNVCW